MLFNTTQSTNDTRDSNDIDNLPILPGLMSLSTRRLIVDVISCGLVPLPLVLGLAGNLLSLVVLSYQGVTQKSNIILIGLATADLLYVACCSYRLMECAARFLNPDLAVELEIHSIVHIDRSAVIFSILSRWHTCFVAVERYIVVRYPLKVSTVLKRNRMIVAIVCLWLAAFACCIIYYFAYEVSEIYNPVMNTTERRVVLSPFILKHLDNIFIYHGLVLPIFSRCIPLLVVLACTCVILRSLRTSFKQRSQMTISASGAADIQQQITKTLVCICVVFLVATIPGNVFILSQFAFFEVGFAEAGRYRNIHAVSLSIVFLSELINSSVNVLFYVLFNQKFTSTCRQLFACGCKTASLHWPAQTQHE